MKVNLSSSGLLGFMEAKKPVVSPQPLESHHSRLVSVGFTVQDRRRMGARVGLTMDLNHRNTVATSGFSIGANGQGIRSLGGRGSKLLAYPPALKQLLNPRARHPRRKAPGSYTPIPISPKLQHYMSPDPDSTSSDCS